MGRTTKKPEEVIVCGICDSTKDYLKYLNEADVKVKFLIDTCKNSVEFDNYKVITIDEYKKNIERFRKIPIVIIDMDSSGKGSFREVLANLVNYPGSENIHILHPAFLVDYIQLNYDNKAFLIGCNRSGSTLLFTIIKKILAKKNNAQFNYKEKIFEKLSREHLEIVTDTLKNTFSHENEYYMAMGATSFGFIDYFGCRKHAFYFINQLRSNRYIFDKVHRTYSKLDEQILYKVRSKGYKIFTPVRNPLDVIVSNAFEVEYVMIKMYPEETFDEIESDFREAYGVSQISNLDWFTNMAIYVKAYFESILDNHTKTNMIKYEDVITNPMETIKRIGSILESDLSKDEIEYLWKEVGFKPLATFKSHLFRPGEGKWKQYLTREHMDIVNSLGYDKLLKELGYRLELKSDKNISAYSNLKYYKNMELFLSIRNNIFHLMFNTPVDFNHYDLLYENVKKSCCDLKIVTNDFRFMNAFNNLMCSNMFNKILCSLDT